jgi:probable HAF family extracellular repeat protein
MGGNFSFGEWINDRGQIVGISAIDAIDPNPPAGCETAGPRRQIARAFLFENGRFRDLGTLGGYEAAAVIIDDAGQVAGTSDVTTTVDPTLGFAPRHAFRLANGVMTDLGTLGGGLSVAFALNSEGAVAGFSTLAGEQHIHAFRWQDGTIADLGALNGDTDSLAYGMNSFGQVVGFSATSTSSRAFLQYNGVMTDLNTLISPSSGYQLAIGSYINDAGEIAAEAVVEKTGEIHTVVLTPSNNSVRGRPGVAAWTPGLRKFLLRRYGLRHLSFLQGTYTR